MNPRGLRLAMTVDQALVVCATHRPMPGNVAVCVLCTRLGVGNHQGGVPWKSEPLTAAEAVLKAADVPRPLPATDN